MPKPRTYELTEGLLAAKAGGSVLCLATHAIGRSFRLYAERPTAYTRVTADGPMVYGMPDVTPVPESPPVFRVELRGPIEQRAGYHDVCSGWTDGHDAIADRLCAALADGDVLFDVDSDGGAVMGGQEAIARVLAAKAAHKRHITTYVDGGAHSMALWWVAAISDEIVVPVSGKMGSIGARMCHTSIEGALAKEGVVVTHIAYPPGKVAFAPEAALSPEAHARGMRDVMIAYDAFTAAMAAGRGLSAEACTAIDADCLTGQAAVDAGLADDVGSLEDAQNYALAMAAREPGETMDPDQEPEAAEEEEPKDPEAEEPEEEEEAPPSSKPAPPPADSAAAKAKPAVPAARKGATPAAMLGLPADASPIKVKAALAPYLQLGDFAMRLTGATSPQGAIGGLQSLADDAAESVTLAAKVKDLRAASNKRERMDLLGQLESLRLPGYMRGDLFVDRVGADGKRIVEPAPLYASTPLATLRGLVAGKVKSAPKAAGRNPFEPDKTAAKTASIAANAGRMTTDPVVQKAAQRSTASVEQLAATAAQLDQMFPIHGANQ